VTGGARTAKRHKTPRPRAAGTGGACSLRTQQRADPPPTTTTTLTRGEDHDPRAKQGPQGGARAGPRHRDGAPRRADESGGVSVMFPPMSAPRPARSAGQAATGPARAHYGRPGEMSSLERR